MEVWQVIVGLCVFILVIEFINDIVSLLIMSVLCVVYVIRKTVGFIVKLFKGT